MLSSVVLAICQALAQQSIAVFRFNFRGVGGSEGTFGRGIGEQEDVKAALTLVSSAPDIDPKRIGLAGYSFGAGVAAAVAAEDSRVNLLALISPALSDSGWQQLQGYSKPKLFVSGSDDSVIPLEHLEHQIRDVPEPKQCEVISGADHFWWEHEAEVAQRVTQFVVTGFKGN